MGASGNDADSDADGGSRKFEPRELFAIGEDRARVVRQTRERELRRAFGKVADETLPDELKELLRRIDQSGNC